MSAKSLAAKPPMSFASLDDLPAAPSLGADIKAMTDADVARRAASDPDAALTPPGFWDTAVIVEPDGTEQITLRLPRRVVSHFKATGKGYHSRISAVLASYVDATGKKTG
jgi:uncharacterized protein (DUF4415 family)